MNGKVGPASDVFSLGATLFHMLAGHHPKTLDQEALRQQLRRGRVDRTLSEICVRCLRPKPRDRYADAGEFGAALAGYLGRSRRRVLFGIIAAALASFLCVGVYACVERGKRLAEEARAAQAVSEKEEIRSVLAKLRSLSGAEREQRFKEAGQILSLAEESFLLAKQFENPEARRLARRLRDLVTAFERGPGREADGPTEDLLRAAAANADGLFDEALRALPAADVERLTDEADHHVRIAVEANLDRAEALEGTRQWGEAAACYRRVRRLDPSSFDALTSLTRSLHELGQWAEAAAAWD